MEADATTGILEEATTTEVEGAIGRPSQLCAVCGAELEPDDAFCTNCGNPRDLTAEEAAATVAVPVVVEGEEDLRRRSSLVLAGILGLAVVAASGLFVWQSWLAGEDLADDAGPAVTTTVAALEHVEGNAITMTLTITDPESAAEIAAAGAQIRVLDANGESLATAISDASGVLVLEAPEPGDYLVELVVESLPEGTIVTSENPMQVAVRPDGATEVGFRLEVGPLDEEVCADSVAQVAAATADMAAAFAGRDFADLGALARTGPTALPGVTDFRSTLDDVAAQLGDLECPEDAALMEYRDLVAALPPTDATSAFALSAAVASVDLGGEDPVDVAMQALAVYPQHDPVPPRGPLAGQLPKWIVILESLEVGAYTETAAEDIAAAYTADLGLATEVLRSDDYESMNPGYWVVYTGWFDEREDARDRCASLRSRVEFCYERYVQVMPSVSAPYGRCGPYGRFDVSGVASGNVLRVHLAPSAESAEIGSYARTATGILAAGPTILVNTTRWLPVVMGPTIGWVDARSLVVDPACGLVPSIASCADVAAATEVLVSDIVRASTSVDTGGLQAAALLDRSGFDTTASGLSTAASVLACDVVALNDMVDGGLQDLATAGPFSSIVFDMLAAQDFFVVG